jgi:hypothetical protein
MQGFNFTTGHFTQVRAAPASKQANRVHSQLLISKKHVLQQSKPLLGAGGGML